MNKENWDFIVRAQGGSFTATDLEKTEEELIKKEKEDSTETDFNIISANYSRSEDSHSKDIIIDDLIVHKAIAKYPILRERMSQVEIRALIKSGAFNVDMSDDAPVVGVSDTGTECEKHRSRINELAKEYANKHASYGTDKYQWVEQNKAIMKKAKKIAGITVEIGKVNDPVKLRMMLEYLERTV